MREAQHNWGILIRSLLLIIALFGCILSSGCATIFMWQCTVERRKVIKDTDLKIVELKTHDDGILVRTAEKQNDILILGSVENIQNDLTNALAYNM
jgi:hypothetical protein